MSITGEEQACLNHNSIWGSAGYPVVKRGRHWFVDGFRGLGACPSRFTTKREATEQWERYIAVLRDRKAGRL